MPASVAVPAITTAVSTGVSIFQSVSANKKAKEARKAIEDYQRQELTNPYSGLQVSTLGADRQREDLGRTMANYGSLAAMGGSRAISSILPNLVAQQNAQEAQIVGSLDQEEAKRQQLIAQGDSMVQQMEEQRENNDLLGLGNELAIYENQKAQAQNNLFQGLVQGGASIAGAMATGGAGKTTATTATPTTPTTPMSDIPEAIPTAGASAGLMPTTAPFTFNTKNRGVINPAWGSLGMYAGTNVLDKTALANKSFINPYLKPRL